MLQKLFESGFRLINGDALNKALSYPQVAYENGITATPSGTVDTSVLLTETISRITAVATAADGVALPAASPGAMMIVVNADAADSMTVFARGGSTINGTAGATGVAQAAGLTALYVCAAVGIWNRLLSA